MAHVKKTEEVYCYFLLFFVDVFVLIILGNPLHGFKYPWFMLI